MVNNSVSRQTYVTTTSTTIFSIWLLVILNNALLAYSVQFQHEALEGECVTQATTSQSHPGADVFTRGYSRLDCSATCRTHSGADSAGGSSFPQWFGSNDGAAPMVRHMQTLVEKGLYLLSNMSIGSSLLPSYTCATVYIMHSRVILRTGMRFHIAIILWPLVKSLHTILFLWASHTCLPWLTWSS